MDSPIISADALLGCISSVRLLEARPGEDLYRNGHLPGAVHADLNRDLSSALAPLHDPKNGGRHPLPPCALFGAALDRWGITKDTDVVVYDDQSGANAAARAWWMLRSFGLKRVRVLDGGWKCALAAGIPVTTLETAFTPTSTKWPDTWGGDGRTTVDIGDIEDFAEAKDWKVLDVRSGERFRGESEPIDPVAGHIPGAVNLFFGENLDAEGRFKPKDELRRMYTELLGGLPPNRLVVHCGSGVTACHTLLALDLARLLGSSLFPGSWSEWCRNDLPRAKGA